MKSGEGERVGHCRLSEGLQRGRDEGADDSEGCKSLSGIRGESFENGNTLFATGVAAKYCMSSMGLMMNRE